MPVVCTVIYEKSSKRFKKNKGIWKLTTKFLILSLVSLVGSFRVLLLC